MKNSPLISVIIPIYNVDKYLARCLDSVLSQSYHNIEVICIDDGSTDTCPEILQRYSARDNRLCVITQENKGTSAARNAGLDIAKGEWLTFVDSDDEVTSDIWTTLLANAGNEDLICFSAQEIAVTDKNKHPINSDYFNVKFSGTHELTNNDLFKLSMTVWDKVFRRSKVEAHALRFPEGMRFEDNVFVLNFTGIYRKARFVPKKLYLYFRHKNAFMENIKNFNKNTAFDCIKILNPIYYFWMKYGLFPQMQSEFERICLIRLREAINLCLPWERLGIAYTLATCLNEWNFIPKCKELLALRNGDLSIYLGSFPSKEITMLKPLKGWQKIFYMGNFQGKKIVRIFTFKIISW